jgi:hypothetical protein
MRHVTAPQHSMAASCTSSWRRRWVRWFGCCGTAQAAASAMPPARWATSRGTPTASSLTSCRLAQCRYARLFAQLLAPLLLVQQVDFHHDHSGLHRVCMTVYLLTHQRRNRARLWMPDSLGRSVLDSSLYLQATAQALLQMDPTSSDMQDVQLTRNIIFCFMQLAQWPAAAQVPTSTC